MAQQFKQPVKQRKGMDENDLKDAIPVEIFLALKNIVRLRSMQAAIEIDELRSRLREFEDGNGCQN